MECINRTTPTAHVEKSVSNLLTRSVMQGGGLGVGRPRRLRRPALAQPSPKVERIFQWRKPLSALPGGVFAGFLAPPVFFVLCAPYFRRLNKQRSSL